MKFLVVVEPHGSGEGVEAVQAVRRHVVVVGQGEGDKNA